MAEVPKPDKNHIRKTKMGATSEVSVPIPDHGKDTS